ncbi:MAG: hypothetical protein ACOYMG_05385 [Candidatus Methylumidiphilus sp.]
MASMNRDLLIEIRVTKENGNFEVSTGYPVSRNLILTSYHGLFPKGFKHDAKILIRWFYQTGELGKFIELDRQAIVWKDEKELDAALLQCNDFKVNQWGSLSPIRPPHDYRWCSEGFPYAADTAQVKGFPIAGKVHGSADSASSFHLSLDDGFKEDMDKLGIAVNPWGGISGAPVFVNGQIIGIIIETPTAAQSRLVATSVKALVEDVGFREAIGYDRQSVRVDTLKNAAEACLKSSPDACQHLAQSLAMSAIESNDIAKAMAGLQAPEAVIRVIKQAHEKACECKDVNAASTLRELALIVFPLYFDTDSVEVIRIHQGNPEIPVANPFVCTGTAAEIAMAAADGQPARFKKTVATDQAPIPHPNGLYTFDHPPHSGIGEETDDNKFKENWDRHIINKYACEYVNKYKFDDLEDRKALLEIASDTLKTVSEDVKRTYYVLIEDTGDDADNVIWDGRAKLIREACPSLVFLRLSKDRKRIVDEIKLINPLCRFLATTLETTP